MSATSPIRVKFLSKTNAEDIEALWAPLIPAEGFENIEFTFDANDTEYDFLAVYEGLPKWEDRKTADRFETLSCPRENALLITTEPASIRLDGPHFMRQFGHILTNKAPELVKHPNQIRQTPPLRWFYGWPMAGGSDWMTADDLSKPIPRKNSDISTVCSTKRMSHTVHAARFDFVMALKSRLPELDIFGKCIKPISDKAEAMRDYRYHIAIENHIEPGHWTEKLADCFLAECLAFYFGDPNYADAFPEDAVIPINIFDIDQAEALIINAMADDEYGKRKNAILEAKRRVLSDYNTLGWVAKFVAGQNIRPQSAGQDRIYSRHAFRRRYPLQALSDLNFRTLAKRKPSAHPLQISTSPKK